jgi:hypothetical protein
MPRLDPTYAQAYRPAMTTLAQIRSAKSAAGRRIDGRETDRLLAALEKAIDRAWALHARGKLSEHDARVDLPAGLAWKISEKLSVKDFLLKRDYARVDARLTELIDYDPGALQYPDA